MIDFNSKRVWGPAPNYPNVLAVPHEARELITIAGPCSIESPEQVEIIAKELSRVGVTYMRGGIFRAGTYPKDDFGMKHELMNEWRKITLRYKLKIIIEIIDKNDLFLLAEVADAVQIGARHMQDYALLDEVSEIEIPVTIKRNMGATLDEFLGAVEYLVRGGKRNVILIERGSTSPMNHIRWELSCSTIAAVKRITGLPILVDASHGSGRRDLVEPLTMAGIAAGADGFLVEVHPDPERSLSDADQALPLSEYENIYSKARLIMESIKLTSNGGLESPVTVRRK